MQVEYFQEPWPYLVVDNYFSDDDFAQLKRIAKKAYLGQGLTKDARNLIVAPKEIAALDKNDYWQFYDALNKERFPNTQIDRELNFLIPSEGNCYEYPVHDEHPDKLLSIVVYISPNHGSGTQLYTEKQVFFAEAEWKPNRAFIFSGQRGKTWHGYKCKSEHKFRLTYNAFIRKSRY